MRKLFALCLTLVGLFLAGCENEKARTPVLAEAYAGPASLKLRSDIPLQSPVVAAVKHGERLQIVRQRRKFLKVRTERGVEGWTEEHLLLNTEEMGSIRDLSRRSKSLPSQGVASTYEALNVHTEPARMSPSFLQIKEGEKVDVLEHRITPRTPPPRKPLVPPPSKKNAAKKPAHPPKYPPLALPAVPGLPPNWLELSKSSLPPELAPAAEAPPEPVPQDDWSLIRTRSGQTGWVLTRRLYMAIPDEVAQYAEGHRISSYFSLGEVRDGDQLKHNWLWTTIGQGLQDYDFDSFRVFIWSLRRHRYETAYIERNLKGYFPVLLEPVEFSGAARTRDMAVSNKYPGFSVCVEKKDGVRYRRSYAFLVNIVRFAGERACEAREPATPEPSGANPVASADAPGEPAPGTLYQRVKSRLTTIARRWFKR